MRVACVGYRDWALSIYDALAKQTDHQFFIVRSREQYDEAALQDFKPDLMLFYGWSWIISAAVLTRTPCVMLHPSPLPKYRGGSPIQNQIIRGETQSAVTLFLMDERLDAGPILGQRFFSLAGSLDDIFTRISTLGLELTLQLLDKGLNPVSQNEAEATSYPRRRPEDSEITIEEIREEKAVYLYNKVRMLQSPYPTAFIRTADGKKLHILVTSIEDEKMEPK